MYTSDTDRHHAAKTAFVYLLVSLFFVLFGAVYEVFSHEVYSFFMLYAFAFPLVGGTLPFSIMSMWHPKNYPGGLTRSLYHCGIAALAVGSVIQGVLDIYGTTNSLTQVYWLAGFGLLAASVITYLMQLVSDE